MHESCSVCYFASLHPPRSLGGYVIVVVCFSVYLSVCLSVCLSVSSFVQKLFREGRQWANEQMIKFWWRTRSRIRIRITTLVRHALAEVRTVPVLLLYYVGQKVSCRFVPPLSHQLLVTPLYLHRCTRPCTHRAQTTCADLLYKYALNIEQTTELEEIKLESTHSRSHRSHLHKNVHVFCVRFGAVLWRFRINTFPRNVHPTRAQQ